MTAVSVNGAFASRSNRNASGGSLRTSVTLEPRKWNQICEKIQVLYEISKSLEEPEKVEL